MLTKSTNFCTMLAIMKAKVINMHLKVSQRIAKDVSNDISFKIRRNKGMAIHKRLGE